MKYYGNFYEFEEIYNELKEKKLKDLSNRDIAKYLLAKDELEWVDDNIGDDKVFYGYDIRLLDNLSDRLKTYIFDLINEDILYNNDLHKEPLNRENEREMM